MISYRLSSIIIALIICSACASNPVLQKEQAEALRSLGEAHMRQENFMLALKELRKAEKLTPLDHLLQNDLGITYLNKKEPALAIRHFSKALEIKPDFGAAKNNLATAYRANKDWDSVIRCSKELIADFNYLWIHYPLTYLGEAYYHKKNFQLAKDYYLKALNHEPVWVKAMLGLGKTYEALGKTPEAKATYADALRTLKDAIKRSPNEVGLYYSLAKVYTRIHEKKKAFEAYNQVAKHAHKTSSLARKARREAELLSELP